MKSLTVLVCVFGLGLSRPQSQNNIGGFGGAGGFRSAPSRPGPALISRPLNSVVGGPQSSLPLSTGPAFRSRGISRAFTGPGGVVSSSGGLVSGQSPLPLTSVSGPTGRGIIRPGGLVTNTGGLVSSGASRVVSGPGRVSVSGPGGPVSGANRLVSGPGGFNSGVNRVVSGPGLASQPGRFVSSGPTQFSSGPGLGVAAGPLVSPTPTRVVSTGPVSAAGPAIQASPVTVSGPVSHPAAHNVGPAQPAVHHGSHGGLPEPVQHNAVHSSISSSPSIVHSSVHSAPVVTEVHHGVHEGGHDGGYDEKPDPFHFEYGVHDDKYYTDFSEQRTGDEYGNIIGEYQVALPDGRIQYVKYTADGNYGGTTMEVSYTGEARHPEHSSHNVIHESSGPIIHEGLV